MTNDKQHSRRSEGGFALFLAVMFLLMAAAAAAGAGSAVLTIMRSNQTHIDREVSLLAAESAALESVERFARTGEAYLVEPGSAIPEAMNPQERSPRVWLETLHPRTATTDGRVKYVAHAVRLDDDGLDNNADGEVDDASERNFAIARGFSRVGDSYASVEIVVDLGDEDRGVIAWRQLWPGRRPGNE